MFDLGGLFSIYVFVLFWVGRLDFGGCLVVVPLLVRACTLLRLIVLDGIWYVVYACLGGAFCWGFVWLLLFTFVDCVWRLWLWLFSCSVLGV